VPPSILAEHRQEGEPLPPVVGPGPDNPLGDYALHLGWPGYLIHGTNKPVSVGLRVSHGCVHLFPEDIAQIYKIVPNGTEVRVVNQPYVFGWEDGRLYMQSPGPLKDDKRPWKKEARRLLAGTLTRVQRQELKRHDEKVDWSRVTQLVDAPAGVPVAVSGIDESADQDSGDGVTQVIAGAKLVQNTLPAGSTWDGKTDLPMSDAEFDKMFSGTAPSQKTPAGQTGSADPSHSAAASPAPNRAGT
jgi:L,D-transpeptidase ErfK/SrfK